MVSRNGELSVGGKVYKAQSFKLAESDEGKPQLLAMSLGTQGDGVYQGEVVFLTVSHPVLVLGQAL